MDRAQMILELEEGAGAVVPFGRKGAICRPLRPTQAPDDRERQGFDARRLLLVEWNLPAGVATCA